MNKTLMATAVVMAMASPLAFAHHPAADRVPEDIYAMIDENVADTPHAEMTFDDMGGAMEAREDMGDTAVGDSRAGMAEGAYMEASEDAGDSAFSESRQEAGAAANPDSGEGELHQRLVGSQSEDGEGVDTFGLMEDVVSALAE